MKLPLIIFFIQVSTINCECESYVKCLNSFVNSFFKSNFETSEIKSDVLDLNQENINKILSGVSSFLNDEIKGITDSEYSLQTNNGTAIFVKTFIIDDRNLHLDDDLYEVDELTINAQSDYNNINNHLTTEIYNTISEEKIQEKNVEESNPISEIDNVINIDYDEDNSTDYPIIDYIELYKDTTNEFIEISTESSVTVTISHEATSKDNTNETKTYFNESCPLGSSDDVTGIFAWIAAIFVKNGTNHFQYSCDGALLSSNVIVTAARCVNFTRAEDIIVILGKTSLQIMRGDEKILKISEIIIHDNFTDTNNDVALLRTEDEVTTSHSVSFACLGGGRQFTEAVTTGWAFSGELTAIHFDKDKSQRCKAKDVCGVYGNDITVCPSFGGLYAVKEDGWRLHGIRTETEHVADGMCLNKPLRFTSLDLYVDWINSSL